MPDFTPPRQNLTSQFADMRGHHVAVRTPSLQAAKDFYVNKLDWRVIAEWDYADEQLAYLAPPADDHFFIEVLGGGDTPPNEVRPYTDLADSLKYRGYHHFCLTVTNVEETIAKLRARGVVIVTEPFVLPAISRNRIIAITSMGGIVTFPGLCVYHGSKFALEGLLEALGKEVADFGIHVTAVEPGAFRTDWAGRSMVRVPRSIPDYDALIDPIRERRNDFSGRQPGDPAKAAEAILKLIASEAPPAHLLLGSDAVRVVREKLAQLGGEIDAWEHISKSTEFA